MTLPIRSSTPGSVAAAAVVAIILSVLSALLTLLATWGILLEERHGQAPPQAAKIAAEVILGIFFAAAIFGVVTAVNLIRLRNWARISILVFAWISGVCSGIGVAVLCVIPMPMEAHAPPGFMSIARFVALSVYGVPCAISVWWIYLFSRNEVKSQFSGQAQYADPQVPHPPRCPAPVAVLAWISLLGVLSVVFFLLVPLRIPVFLFGHAIAPALGKTYMVILGSLGAAAGIGILKLKPWSYFVAIGLHTFYAANAVCTALAPGYPEASRKAREEMFRSMHLPVSEAQSAAQMQHAAWGLYGGITVAAVFIGILLYYRRQFLEAAAAVSATQPPS
jgi:hypothetical protein